MSGGTRVVHNNIKWVVLQNTAPDANPLPEAVQSLQKFLKNPATIDTGIVFNCFRKCVLLYNVLTILYIPVYRKIMERIQTDRTHSQVVVSRALRILKIQLFKYSPSPEVLEELDLFCVELIRGKIGNPKTIKYIRAVIKNNQQQNVQPQFSKVKLKTPLREVS